MAINWTHPSTLAFLAAIPGFCATVWAFYNDRRLRKINAKIARISAKLEREKEGAIHVFKASFDLELSAYKEMWETLWMARDATLQLAPIFSYAPLNEDEN